MAHLETLDNSETVLRNDWYPIDVINCSRNMDLADNISYDDAIEILQSIADRFDANIGVNWLVIENAIQHYIESSK